MLPQQPAPRLPGSTSCYSPEKEGPGILENYGVKRSRSKGYKEGGGEREFIFLGALETSRHMTPFLFFLFACVCWSTWH